MELELEGHDATLHAAYHAAGRLPVYRVQTIGPDLFRIDSLGATVHPVWYAAKPLTVRLPRTDTVAWEWQIEGLCPQPDEEGALTLYFSGDPRTVKL